LYVEIVHLIFEWELCGIVGLKTLREFTISRIVIVEIHRHKGLYRTWQDILLSISKKLWEPLPIELCATDHKVHHILLGVDLGFIRDHWELREHILIFMYSLQLSDLLIYSSKGSLSELTTAPAYSLQLFGDSYEFVVPLGDQLVQVFYATVVRRNLGLKLVYLLLENLRLLFVYVHLHLQKVLHFL